MTWYGNSASCITTLLNGASVAKLLRLVVIGKVTHACRKDQFGWFVIGVQCVM